MPVAFCANAIVFCLIDRNIESIISFENKNGRTDILYSIDHQIEGQALPSVSNITQTKRECKHFLNYFRARPSQEV